MSKEERKVPELRFKGFYDDWEQRKFKELYEVVSGYAFKKIDYVQSGVPIVNGESIKYHKIIDTNLNYLPKEFISKYRKAVLSDGDIVVGLNRPIINGKLKIARIPGQLNNSLLYQRAGKINFREEINNVFSYTILENEITNFTLQEAVGSDQPFISTNKLGDWRFSLPTTKTEQTNIGNLFQKLNDVIALHQRKINILKEQKKAYFSLIFPQKNEYTPKLRFEVFKREWEQRLLKSISERVRGNDGRMTLPTLTISAAKGWLDQRDRFSGNIAGKEQKNYTLLSRNELSYNKGNSKIAKYGVVYKLDDYSEALVPRVYHSFKTTSEANPDFLEYLFATKIPDRELSKLITSGARMDGLLNINFDDFMNIKIYIPNKDEQDKVAILLRKLDQTIALHQIKLDNLTQMKQIYLTKMFI